MANELGEPIIWAEGAKPEWLADDELCQLAFNPVEYQHRYMTWDYLKPRLVPAWGADWAAATAFRVRADHPFYSKENSRAE